MADRHAVDDAQNALAWEATALATFDHLATRARETTTGMYYAALVTSADPNHDTVDATAPSAFPSDALLTEVQGSVALSMMRASALAAQSPALNRSKSYPFGDQVEALFEAMNGKTVSLWDGFESEDAGAGAGYVDGT
jgi:hypothetical protein